MNESRRAKLHALDLRVDQFLEPTRNFKPTIWLFTTATALGDFGMLWHIVGIVRAVSDNTRIKQALILSALMGRESAFESRHKTVFQARTTDRQRRLAIQDSQASHFEFS